MTTNARKDELLKFAKDWILPETIEKLKPLAEASDDVVSDTLARIPLGSRAGLSALDVTTGMDMPELTPFGREVVQAIASS